MDVLWAIQILWQCQRSVAVGCCAVGWCALVVGVLQMDVFSAMAILIQYMYHCMYMGQCSRPNVQTELALTNITRKA